jgi:hypothetical protein
MFDQQLDLYGQAHDVAPAHEQPKLFGSAPQLRGQIALETDDVTQAVQVAAASRRRQVNIRLTDSGELELADPPPSQTIDKYGCLRDDRYPGVIFGREHPTSWEHIAFRPVASHNGRSTWGYMLRCRCGVESIATTSSSVGYEDAPGRFAWEHRECEIR